LKRDDIDRRILKSLIPKTDYYQLFPDNLREEDIDPNGDETMKATLIPIAS